MGGTHATAAREFLLPNAFNAVHTRMIKEAVHIPVFIGHNIFTPEEAEAMLAEGNGDFVALGRSQLADPAWARKARCGKAGDIKPCINCMIGCIDKGMLGHTPIHCTVNPTLYKYECEPITEAAEKKRVAIVGAGPAGCEAALTASKRGHQVTLFEKRGFGGAMVEASRPDNKANIRRLIRYYEEHILADPNITLVKENADFDTLANGGFDAVILANGGKTRRLQVPGGDSEQVLYASDYLLGNRKAEGTRAVVIGGGVVGLEAAWELKKYQCDVTILEAMPSLMSNKLDSSASHMLQEIFEANGIAFWRALLQRSLKTERSILKTVL